jgi:hypothetical protein
MEGSAWEVLAGTRGVVWRRRMVEVACRKEVRRCELMAEVGIGWVVQQNVGVVCIAWDFSVDLDGACIMGVEV